MDQNDKMYVNPDAILEWWRRLGILEKQAIFRMNFSSGVKAMIDLVPEDIIKMFHAYFETPAALTPEQEQNRREAREAMAHWTKRYNAANKWYNSLTRDEAHLLKEKHWGQDYSTHFTIGKMFMLYDYEKPEGYIF